jgi:alkanesulfonate monooxygenase SsuD/methylene tetrahydromethanopterin reductase-like flavin-dependent oxidoreductase (luciferase family)
MQILSDGRFTLGLGSGENLNEHVIGKGWPSIHTRQDMLREAIKIIRELFGGRLVNWRGEYFQVDSARLWDVPDVPVGIALAMGGQKAIEKFAKLADHLVAVQPDKGLVDAWHGARQAANGAEGGRVIGQIPVCWDPDRNTAIARAHDQFRWFGGGWSVMPTYRRQRDSPARPSSCVPGCRRKHSLRAGLGCDRGRRPPLLGGRLHRCRAGPDRRRATRTVSFRSRRSPAQSAAGGFVLSATAWREFRRRGAFLEGEDDGK